MYKRYSPPKNFNSPNMGKSASKNNSQSMSYGSSSKGFEGNIRSGSFVNNQETDRTNYDLRYARNINNHNADNIKSNNNINARGNAGFNSSDSVKKSNNSGGSSNAINNRGVHRRAGAPVKDSLKFSAGFENSMNNEKKNANNSNAKSEKNINFENRNKKQCNNFSSESKANNKDCCTGKVSPSGNEEKVNSDIKKIINSFLDMLPSSVYNKESKKFFSIIGLEDLLLIVLIFLLTENGDGEESLLIYALLYLLISDYVDIPL